MSRVNIDSAVIEGIRRHLISAYPNEGCGFLLGGVRKENAFVCRFIPVRNERLNDAGARNRFLISPMDFKQAETRARRHSVEIVGTYHSHPDVAAVPSEFDREHALPWFRYLIVSVVGGEPCGERVYRLETDRSRFKELELEVEERQNVS